MVSALFRDYKIERITAFKNGDEKGKPFTVLEFIKTSNENNKSMPMLVDTFETWLSFDRKSPATKKVNTNGNIRVTIPYLRILNSMEKQHRYVWESTLGRILDLDEVMITFDKDEWHKVYISFYDIIFPGVNKPVTVAKGTYRMRNRMIYIWKGFEEMNYEYPP
mmetsp:Transcript_44916/g.50370  ORF Transcript_44916/g.50370 Transcript_44916/m.50370 type:complete len:164 (+) Transcript_44916:894-1385(+)